MWADNMITTHEADKAALLSFSSGITTWRTATLNLGTLYVFFNHGLKHSGRWIFQTSILWDSRDVIDFCRNVASNKAAKVVDITLLEPYQRGQVRSWRLTTVLKICVFEEDFAEHPVYFTDAGEVIGLTPSEAKQRMKTLYKARQSRTAGNSHRAGS